MRRIPALPAPTPARSQREREQDRQHGRSAQKRSKKTKKGAPWGECNAAAPPLGWQHALNAPRPAQRTPCPAAVTLAGLARQFLYRPGALG